MSDIDDDEIEEEEEGSELSDVPPYGSASSAAVSFCGPGIDQLRLTVDSDDAAAAAADADADADALSPSSSSSSSSLPLTTTSMQYQEVGDAAVWSLSSAKMGNGVQQLRDNDPATFWQSDGFQPHVLTLSYARKVRLSHLCIYLDQKTDESYSPARIAVRVGNGSARDIIHASAAASHAHLHGGRSVPVAAKIDASADVREIANFNLDNPQGWVVVDLAKAAKESATAQKGEDDSVRCHFLQLIVLASYQNGRDTHIRQVKIFGPRSWVRRGLVDDLANLTSLEMQQFAMIR